jgi:hypothetical protein
MIKIVPEKVVGYNEVNEPLFTLECYDDTCATLELHSNLVTRAGWVELSQAVYQAIKTLYPDET